MRRITTSDAIDTEPVWSPDGQSLYFTSDRGGSPQIYKVNLNGSAPQRITFDGNYNARARISPDGQTLAMVHRENGHLHIAVMNLNTGALLTLTDADLDKSPSFAPNGSMIIYEANYRGQGVLADLRWMARCVSVLGNLVGRKRACSRLGPIPVTIARNCSVSAVIIL